MDVTEKWGDDVDSAVELALSDLKLTRDQVDVEVLEQPSRGFFGIGSKLALVRVSRKKEEKKEEPAAAPKQAEAEAPAVSAPAPAEEEAAPAEDTFVRRPERSERHERSNDRRAGGRDQHQRKSRDGRQGRRSGQGNRDGRRNGRRQGGNREDRNENYVSRLPELDFHKQMDGLPETPDHPAVKFLQDVIRQMGLDLTITCRSDATNVLVELEGKDTRTIIGKRGQTLDSLQYLTSLVVNKGQEDYIRVVLDAENYRSRREKTLEQLADKLARKVVRSGRSVRLEPMNPYERKIIHSALQNDPDVTTRSEGQDPYRRVIVELKK